LDNKIIFQDYIQEFSNFSLENLETTDFLDRFDTKFIVRTSDLDNILNYLNLDYKCLKIQNDSIFDYTSHYYDTINFDFYLQHHNNKVNRIKLRSRHYKETNQTFFELKNKLKTQKTIKFRKEFINNAKGSTFLGSEHYNNYLGDFLTENDLYLQNRKLKDLEEKLSVNYQRISLVSNDLREKLTIDFDINFAIINKNKVVNIQNPKYLLNGISIIEIKQNKINYNSDLISYLKKLNYRPDYNFSKYCFGLIYTQNNLKYNNFKPTLLYIKKLLSSN